ncbi:DUF4834 family protein [Sphingobacterium faecium]|uniref:DUF4834 family protein n=1 Tax=Sphingobacterium faecium TaxID=34087 RepID=UPI00320A3B4C
MAGLLKFLLIAFAVWYLVKFLIRLILPFAMRKAAEKLMKKAQQQGGATYTNGGGSFHYETFGKDNSRSQSAPKNDGRISVDYVPPKQEHKRKVADDAGEFVDFEEIK